MESPSSFRLFNATIPVLKTVPPHISTAFNQIIFPFPFAFLSFRVHFCQQLQAFHEGSLLLFHSLWNQARTSQDSDATDRVCLFKVRPGRSHLGGDHRVSRGESGAVRGSSSGVRELPGHPSFLYTTTTTYTTFPHCHNGSGLRMRAERDI